MNLIWHSWLTSFRTSKYAGLLPRKVYFDAYKEAIALVMARSRLVVAYDPEEQDERLDVQGWLAVETPRRAVHYCYVKEHCRRQGVARALLCVGGIEWPQQFTYSYRTPAWAEFLAHTRWSAIHDPWVARDTEKTKAQEH